MRGERGHSVKYHTHISEEPLEYGLHPAVRWHHSLSILRSITHTHTPSSRRLVWVAVLLFRALLFFPTLKLRRRSGDEQPEREMTECMISERRCWFGSRITDLSTCAGSQPMNRFQRCWISQNKRRKPANIPLALEVTSPNPLYTLKHTCKREWPHVENISVTIK